MKVKKILVFVVLLGVALQLYLIATGTPDTSLTWVTILMLASSLTFVFAFMYAVKDPSRLHTLSKTSEEENEENPTWSHGDDWQMPQKNIDPTLWTEVYTQVQGYSNVFAQGVDALKRPEQDVFELMQTLQNKYNITVQMYPSQKTSSPASALWVPKDELEKAKQALLEINPRI